jgi:two-component system, NtrC family, sensor kinase
VRNIQKRVLVPLTLTFLVLIISFLYSGYQIRQSDAKAALEYRHQAARSLYQTLVDQRLESMRGAAQFICADQNLQKAMRAGDTDALFELATPILQRMSLQQDIKLMYFHTTDGENLLRVHKPFPFPYSMERHTIQQAIRTQRVSQGVELGPLGAFTLRVVYPWHSRGELIGYIELGQEVNRILRDLKSITSIEYLLTIRKDLLEKEMWEAGMKMLGRDADWYRLRETVVVDQSISIENFNQFRIILSRNEIDTQIGFGGRHYRAKNFPLLDAGGKAIGSFVLLQDVTADIDAFGTFTFKIVAFSLLLCSTLFAFAFQVLGRVDQQMASNRQQLLDQVDRATLANYQLEIEVSERKRAEEKLKRLNESLEERVTERTSKLEEVNRELEASHQKLELAYRELKDKQATILHQDKMACIGLLAAGVAHDINNPIGFVSSNLSELAEYVPRLCRFIKEQEEILAASGIETERLRQTREELQLDYMLEDIDSLIEESLEGTERVSKIVQNLRAFSRIDDSEARFTDIHECLDSTINITSHELRYKATVVREYGELPRVLCRAQQINQVLMNLLINAAQSIEEQGTVTVRTWSENGFVCISIADTGCGIDEENCKQIFEPFFTTKEVGKGTGLGLSIVYDIIKKHKGDISVESTPGLGTTFTLRLPVAP